MVDEFGPHPVGGVDYPRTLQEFDDWFSSEAACRTYLQRLRWRESFRCPKCAGNEAWKTNTGHLKCKQCRHRTSATAGTIFEGTQKPLRVWFQAMWYVTSRKSGGSALGLQQLLGLGSYQTAWSWLHKLRRAMVRPSRDRLRGCVEVDETYVGGDEEGVHGRQTEDKAIVVVAAEEEGRGIGRIRLRRVPDVSGDSLEAFIEESVTPGSVVHTDGWKGYGNIAKKSYTHQVTILSQSDEPAHKLMPRVHLVASHLKRWLLGTHQGAVSQQHLDYYLDEFTFRFNRRRSRARGMLFYRLLDNAVRVDPVPYKQLVGGTSASGADHYM
jgi:transposase-like protein